MNYTERCRGVGGMDVFYDGVSNWYFQMRMTRISHIYFIDNIRVIRISIDTDIGTPLSKFKGYAETALSPHAWCGNKAVSA